MTEVGHGTDKLPGLRNKRKREKKEKTKGEIANNHWKEEND